MSLVLVSLAGKNTVRVKAICDSCNSESVSFPIVNPDAFKTESRRAIMASNRTAVREALDCCDFSTLRKRHYCAACEPPQQRAIQLWLLGVEPPAKKAKKAKR